MTRVQADPALKEALTRNGERVEVCDESGQVIGYALSPTELERLQRAQQRSAVEIYALADQWFDPDALKRASADPHRISMEEVLKRLGME